jgi:hypothetical protein
MPNEPRDLPQLASTEALEVDVAHLDNISQYLTTVADAITSIRDSTLHQAHRLATVGGESTESAGGPSALGSQSITEVRDLATRENGTFMALDTSLKSMADNLRRTAEGISEMAEQYQTVEERNAITAAEWTRAISG